MKANTAFYLIIVLIISSISYGDYTSSTYDLSGSELSEIKPVDKPEFDENGRPLYGATATALSGTRNQKTIFIERHVVPDGEVYCIEPNDATNIYGAFFYEWSATGQQTFYIEPFKREWYRVFLFIWRYRIVEYYPASYKDEKLPFNYFNNDIEWKTTESTGQSRQNKTFSHAFIIPSNETKCYRGVAAVGSQINNEYTANHDLTFSIGAKGCAIQIDVPLSFGPDTTYSGWGYDKFFVHKYCRCSHCTSRLANMSASGNDYDGYPPCLAVECGGKCKNNCQYCYYQEPNCCTEFECPYEEAWFEWYLGNNPNFPNPSLCNCEYVNCYHHPNNIYCKTHGHCYYCGANNATASLELPWQP